MAELKDDLAALRIDFHAEDREKTAMPGGDEVGDRAVARDLHDLRLVHAPDVERAARRVVGDVLRNQSLVETEGHLDDCLFRFDADGLFTGAIPVTALMRSDGSRPLSDLPIRRIRPLSSRATLGSAAFLDEWDEFLMLPVVGRKQTVVGGLSRAGLRKGLHEHRTTRDLVPGSMAGHVLAAFAATCTGLMRMAADTKEQ